ncbi:hypothetical protein Tco_0794427 [Tanacetum coccineum]
MVDKILSPEAFAKTWEVLMKKMTGKYLSAGELTIDSVPKLLPYENPRRNSAPTWIRQSENKRKADDSSRNNHGHQQQPFKRQNVAKVYNMGTGEKKPDTQ